MYEPVQYNVVLWILDFEFYLQQLEHSSDLIS